ncbi:hypothetical protein YC2023_053104 [Brassica napus]
MKKVLGVRRPAARESACRRQRAPPSPFLFVVCCSSSLCVPCRYACGFAVGLRPDLFARGLLDLVSSLLLLASRRGSEVACAADSRILGLCGYIGSLWSRSGSELSSLSQVNFVASLERRRVSDRCTQGRWCYVLVQTRVKVRVVSSLVSSMASGGQLALLVQPLFIDTGGGFSHIGYGLWFSWASNGEAVLESHSHLGVSVPRLARLGVAMLPARFSAGFLGGSSEHLLGLGCGSKRQKVTSFVEIIENQLLRRRQGNFRHPRQR